jgi:hypothetical protein
MANLALFRAFLVASVFVSTCLVDAAITPSAFAESTSLPTRRQLDGYFSS